MQNMKSQILNRFKLIFSLIFFSFLLNNCANIQMPSGGPKDKTPPAVISYEPMDKAINYNENFIKINFSKWVDRNKVIQNISISPPTNLKYSWSGKELEIQFENKLKAQTTYSFLIGTEYTDLKGNKPDSAFSLTFSTGNKIDTGRIDGYLVGEKAVGAYIYCYRIDNKNPDTLSTEQTPTEYKTQVGGNGLFSLRALPDGTYRIFAVKTDFKDNLFHPNSDYFGATTRDFVVKNGNSDFVKLKIEKYPNYSPLSIVYNKNYVDSILVFQFNKPVFLFSKNIEEEFKLYDSTHNQNLLIKSVFLDSINSKKLFAKINDKIQDSINYVFSLLKDSILVDTSQVYSTRMSYSFTSNSTNQNYAFKMNYFPFKDSTQRVKKETKLQFTFNKPIMIDTTVVPVELIDLSNNKKMLFESILLNQNSLLIEPNQELNADSWYRLKINLSAIKSIDNEIIQDSILKYDFKTENWRTFSDISGVLLDSIGCEDIILNLISSNNTIIASTKVNPDKTFNLSNIPEGSYKLEGFCDENKNGKYDYGKAYPFQFSEHFVIFSNTIEVKPRWNIKNLMLLFDDKR
jgi:hypothetical protein